MSASDDAKPTHPTTSRRADLGLLALRLTAGGLLAGHGAQKLFGSFGGHGLEGTAGWLESIGFKPGKRWAVLAGASEFGGGAMTAVGLAHPIGPIALQGAMATAARTMHWDKPIWNTEGGAELPLLFSAAGLSLALTGPGRYSFDRTFGLRVPKKLTALALASTVAGIALANQIAAKAAAQTADAEASEETASDESTTSMPVDQLVESRPGSIGAAPTADLQVNDDPYDGLDRFADVPPSVP